MNFVYSIKYWYVCTCYVVTTDLITSLKANTVSLDLSFKDIPSIIDLLLSTLEIRFFAITCVNGWNEKKKRQKLIKNLKGHYFSILIFYSIYISQCSRKQLPKHHYSNIIPNVVQWFQGKIFKWFIFGQNQLNLHIFSKILQNTLGFSKTCIICHISH